MDTLREYATQSILGAMQAVVVLYGLLTNATMMKAMGVPERALIWRFGIIWFAVPILWVAATIYMERTEFQFSKRYTILTGLAVLGFLVWYFCLAATGRSFSPTYF